MRCAAMVKEHGRLIYLRPKKEDWLSKYCQSGLINTLVKQRAGDIVGRKVDSTHVVTPTEIQCEGEKHHNT